MKIKYKKYIVSIVSLSSCDEKKSQNTDPSKSNLRNDDTLIETNSSPENKNSKPVDEIGPGSNKNGNQKPKPEPGPVPNRNENQNPEPTVPISNKNEKPEPLVPISNEDQKPEPQPSPAPNGNQNIQVKSYKEITGLENIDQTKTENFFKNNSFSRKILKILLLKLENIYWKMVIILYQKNFWKNVKMQNQKNKLIL